MINLDDKDASLANAINLMNRHPAAKWKDEDNNDDDDDDDGDKKPAVRPNVNEPPTKSTKRKKVTQTEESNQILQAILMSDKMN